MYHWRYRDKETEMCLKDRVSTSCNAELNALHLRLSTSWQADEDDGNPSGVEESARHCTV
jgi:hypothetical protein